MNQICWFIFYKEEKKTFIELYRILQVMPSLPQTTVNSTICRRHLNTLRNQLIRQSITAEKCGFISAQIRPLNPHYLLSVVLSLSTRPHSSQKPLTQRRHCAPLKTKTLTSVVPVQTLVISDSPSAELLFPPQYFPSVAEPATKRSRWWRQSWTQSSLDHSHVPPPEMYYQAERELGICCFCLHTTRKKIPHNVVTTSTSWFTCFPMAVGSAVAVLNLPEWTGLLTGAVVMLVAVHSDVKPPLLHRELFICVFKDQWSSTHRTLNYTISSRCLNTGQHPLWQFISICFHLY